MCRPNYIEIGSECVSLGLVIGLGCIPIVAVAAVLLFYIFVLRTNQLNALWKIDPKELHFDDPPQQIGHGGFGVVLLAEYRGTTVAVKKLNSAGFGSGIKSIRKTSSRTNLSGKMPSGDSMNASRVYKHKPTHNTDGRKRQDDYDVESGMISGSFLRSLQIVEQSASPIKASLADFESDMQLLTSLRHPCITTIMGAVIAKHQ